MRIAQTIESWDKAIFLALNNIGVPQLDGFMLHATNWAFVPLAAIALYLIWKKYSKTKFWLAILLFALALVFSDQACGIWLKELELRVRPCYDQSIIGQFRNVKVWLTGSCGGETGFPSAHASNAFALAVLTGVMFWKRHKALVLTAFFIAVFIAYSRIYLGLHFFGDAFCGGLVGTFCGLVFGNVKKL